MNHLAPVVLFIYNRPKHLRVCLESLILNEEIFDSDLYIFADGPKKNSSFEELEKIRLSREIAKEKKWAGRVHLIEREINMGLSESIIKGVSYVIDLHGKAIVLEDDLVFGRYFLKFMNDSLNKYEKDASIAQVSGFLFPIKTELKNEAFLIPLTTTLGWATWKRVWNSVNFYPDDYKILKTNKKLREEFDLNGSYPYTKMMFNQMNNPNYGSWGIRFWWHVFKEKQLVVYPDYPLLQHRDKDFSGTHKSNYDFMDEKNWNENYLIKYFPTIIDKHKIYFGKLTLFFRKTNSLFEKIKRYFISKVKIRTY